MTRVQQTPRLKRSSWQIFEQASFVLSHWQFPVRPRNPGLCPDPPRLGLFGSLLINLNCIKALPLPTVGVLGISKSESWMILGDHGDLGGLDRTRRVVPALWLSPSRTIFILKTSYETSQEPCISRTLPLLLL